MNLPLVGEGVGVAKWAVGYKDKNPWQGKVETETIPHLPVGALRAEQAIPGL